MKRQFLFFRKNTKKKKKKKNVINLSSAEYDHRVVKVNYRLIKKYDHIKHCLYLTAAVVLGLLAACLLT